MKLKLSNISFSFNDNQILKDINLNINEKEFVTILGASGCGKSTLLNIISGLRDEYSGSIYIDANEIKGISQKFSYMPQEDLLLPWKTVYENVCLWDKIHKIKSDKEYVISLIKEFGLDGYANKYPRHLSGGMKQRVAFLRTALCDTDIWLLDEPFGALDVITRKQMQEWLKQVRKKFDKTMVLVTHDVDEAIYLSDRIFVLGQKPATIIEEIDIKNINKNSISDCNILKDNIYNILNNL